MDKTPPDIPLKRDRQYSEHIRKYEENDTVSYTRRCQEGSC